MSMTDQELAYNLGMALEALGRIKGGVYALRDTVLRELGDSYVSEDLGRLIDEGLQDIQMHTTTCYRAISGPVELDEAKGQNL